MAHTNIDLRRKYVKRCLNKGLSLKEIILKGASKYNCSQYAIISDFKLARGIKLKPSKKKPSKHQRLRLSIFERDNFICQYCGLKKENLILEHILPLSQGGQWFDENLVTACQNCNMLKKKKVWIPKNFLAISETNKTHQCLILSIACKDFW